MTIVIARCALLFVCCLTALFAQSDPLQDLGKKVKESTDGVLSFTIEERTRWEEKFGVNFGKAVNQQDMLSRVRIGVQFTPFSWFKISAMGQDSRAPFFGVVAPTSMRDSIDLHESYVQILGCSKTGFGMNVGRQMLDYGEGRVIGTPQWSNTSRTYDEARVYYGWRKAKFEALMVSPVKILADAYNRPELGQRIWGTYDTFGDVWKKASLDVYILRHSQNNIGGWSGAGTLGTNSFGGRFFGPLPRGFAYSFEGVGQAGHSGLLQQRAFSAFGGVTKKTTVAGKPFVLSAEYKVASGTKAGSINSGTYDQLAPANHDKFGHLDLFGWRNLKTFKSLETLNVTKSLAVNLMYTNHWLYSATDSLFNGQGAVLATSKTGVAGTHVGQELDAFATYKRGAHTFGAGFGHLFKGEFIDIATSRINPRYFYFFQQYTIK